MSRKELEILLQGFRRRFREFGAISRTCQNPPCSKPWAIAQAFCSKTANFLQLRIHPKSTQKVAQGVRNPFTRVQEAFQRVWCYFQNLPKSAMFKTMGYSPGFLLENRQFSTLANSPEIGPKSCARSQKSFYKGLGGVSESLERFPELAKIRHVQNHGLQPRLFARKPPIFDTCEFTRNRPKKSRKELEILLQGFRRRFREFGAISRTCQNSPCSKTMGYSPGFLLKNRQFSTLVNSPEIDPKSRARSQKSFYKGLGGVSESLERFPDLDKIRHVQNHGLQPSIFAQKSLIFDTCEFTRMRPKKSRKELEILLQGFRRRFREFGAISRTCQNTPCSKPWAIPQACCSKTANFRNLRIHPKSTQKVAQ